MKPAAAFAALACLPTCAFASDDRNAVERAADGSTVWSLSIGAETSRTDFARSASQDVAFLPLAIGVAFGGWSFDVESGWLEVDVAANRLGSRTVTIPSIAGRPARTVTLPTAVPVKRSTSGVADTTVSARYDFAPIADRLAFALAGSVKLPTADEKEGLGSGETDYSLAAEVAAVGRITPYLGAGVQALGEPEGVDYDDPVFGYAGVDFEATERVLASLVYDYAEAAAAGIDESSSLEAALRWRATDRVRLAFSAAAGLSDAAPDTRFAIRLTLRSR